MEKKRKKVCRKGKINYYYILANNILNHSIISFNLQI